MSVYECQIPKENLELFLRDKKIDDVLGEPVNVSAKLRLSDYDVDLRQHVIDIEEINVKEVRSRLYIISADLEEQGFTNEELRGYVRYSPNSEFTRYNKWKDGKIIITIKDGVATVESDSEIPLCIQYHKHPYGNKTIKELLEMTTSDLLDPFEFAKVRVTCIASKKKLRAGELYVVDPLESEDVEEINEIEPVLVIGYGNWFVNIVKGIFGGAYEGLLMIRGKYFPPSKRLEADEILKTNEHK